jgi:hypothetical protein
MKQQVAAVGMTLHFSTCIFYKIALAGRRNQPFTCYNAIRYYSALSALLMNTRMVAVNKTAVEGITNPASFDYRIYCLCG